MPSTRRSIAIILLVVFVCLVNAGNAQNETAPAKPANAKKLTAPTEQVQVTAYRSAIAPLDSPTGEVLLNEKDLLRSAEVSLDGKLRQAAGFQLFRRSSSLVANPTTEGVSLRGLGSTAASRTLVLLGDLPLNDPYGGWVHWEELPELSLGRVEVVRSGVSDLYGSSAMGGVVQVETLPLLTTDGGCATGQNSQSLGEAPCDTTPIAGTHPWDLTLVSGYGAEALNDNGVRFRAAHGPWSGMVAGQYVDTDGYILVAPNLRGPVDATNNVHFGNGLGLAERRLGAPGSGNRVWLRANGMSDNRHNGTRLTGNSTDLVRVASGVDWKDWQGRLWGSGEHFYQNFSSVSTGRVSETVTRNVIDPATELGAALRWHRGLGAGIVALAGADVRDVRSSDVELPTSPATPATSTTDRQTDAGGYGELLWTPHRWLLSGSARIDRFVNASAATYTLATGAKAPLPRIDATVVNPRAGVSYRLRHDLSVSASAFRGFRAPTPNELYRNGQVGQQNTLANPLLQPERATGWEAGLAGETPARWGANWRVSYFWTEVNHPVTALTLSTTPTQTILMRENLGQIRSRGLQLDGGLHPLPWLALKGGYQFARATVSQYNQEPVLVGKWIPQVPRNLATLSVTADEPRIGLLRVEERVSGRQFDDDVNAFLLHSYARTDVYAARDFAKRWQVFASVENLFDRSIDVGRTPIRTLGTPQLARFGIEFRLGSGS